MIFTALHFRLAFQTTGCLQTPSCSLHMLQRESWLCQVSEKSQRDWTKSSWLFFCPFVSVPRLCSLKDFLMCSVCSVEQSRRHHVNCWVHRQSMNEKTQARRRPHFDAAASRISRAVRWNSWPASLALLARPVACSRCSGGSSAKSPLTPSP